MKRFLIISMTIALVFVGSFNSQSQELTAEKKADINRLFEITGARKNAVMVADQICQQMISSIQVKNPTLPAKTLDIVREEIGKAVTEATTQKGGLFDLAAIKSSSNKLLSGE
jgi:hypothetical protein